MLKTHTETFSFFQKVADLLIVAIIWCLSYFIRFRYLPNAQDGLAMIFLQLTPFIMFFTLYFFYTHGLYRSQRFSSRYKEILAVCKSNLSANLSFIILIYFLAPERVSRFLLALYFLLSTFALIVLRLSIRNYLRSLRRKGKNLRHILLVGNGPQLEQYIKTAREYKDAGLEFLSWVDGNEEIAKKYNIKLTNQNLNTIKEILKPHVIVLGYAGSEAIKVEQIIKQHYNDLVPIQVVPDLTYAFIGHQIEDFSGVPLLTVNQPSFNSFELFIKKALDLTLSLIGLIILSPFLFLIAIAVKITSRGPIFYGQERMGLDGQKFNMWKFRTMRFNQDIQSNIGGWTKKDDPRKTKLGNLLRKTSLDELPQLWNVIKGDMSLVGPRPEQPYFVNKFKEEIPAYMLRHKMKAGLTGWAQVNGWRGDTSLHKRIECDIYYIKHWSLWFDLKILFLTIWRGFINKNAY